MSFLSSLFGFGGSKPATQQTIQATRLPEEVAPFAKDVLGDAQKLYEAQMAKGYTPYLDPTIAPMTEEQLQAQEGLKGLVGTSRPLQEEALGMYRAGADRFTDLSPEQMESYMSPYQRAVTDIEKREAQKVFESQIMPKFEKQAVSAGGMSGMGSRAGVQAAQLGQAQMQQMGDIESKGLQSAYKDARNLFQQQQQAQRAAAGSIAGMAPTMLASGISEQGLLATVGEQKQALGQQALDEAYYRYLEEQSYPQEQLAGYSGFVYGNPLMQQRDVTTTRPAASGPSPGSQLLGLGMTAAKMYGMGGGWSGDYSGQQMMQNMFGPSRKTGGRLSGRTGGGLSSLPVVYRQNGGSGYEGPWAGYSGLGGIEWGGMMKEGHPEARKEREEGYRATLKAQEKAERLERIQKNTPRPATPMSEAEALIADRIKIAESRQAFSPKEIERRAREDAANLQKLLTQRAGERKTATQDYQDRMEEARKGTFEAQQGLVPTGHAGYERAMKSLLAGTPAGREPRGLFEAFLGAGTEMIGGIREGEAAKQEALAKIEQRRGTAEMEDIEAYRTMEAADEEAAFKSELAMIKDVNPSLWKSIQKRRNELVAAGLSEAQIIASMRSHIASEKLDIEKAKAEGTGVKIKAADYSAAKGIFLDMLKLGRFRGHTNAKGDIVRITTIDGKSLSPQETKRLEKIMSTMFATVASSGIPKAIEEARVALNITDKPTSPEDPKKGRKLEVGDIVTKRRNGKVGKYEYLGPDQWRPVN